MGSRLANGLRETDGHSIWCTGLTYWGRMDDRAAKLIWMGRITFESAVFSMATEDYHENSAKDGKIPHGDPWLSPLKKRRSLVLRIFFKILVIWANFGEFWWFWYRLQNFEKSCNVCAPILGPILENFDFEILVRSQSYNKPPWRNFDFLSNFDEIEKFEIWWNWQFWWTSKFGFWQNLEIWHRSPKSNHQFG